MRYINANYITLLLFLLAQAQTIFSLSVKLDRENGSVWLPGQRFQIVQTGRIVSTNQYYKIVVFKFPCIDIVNTRIK